MIIVPEIIVFNMVEGVLKHLKSDYDAKVNKDDSLISKVMKGVTHYKNDWFTQGLQLFTRDNGSPRKIETRMHLDAERSNVPTIHIVLAGENVGANTLSDGMGSVSELSDGTIHEGAAKRMDATIQIVCTSDNHSETLMMYHIVRAFLISSMESFSLYGLENPKISGSALSIQQHLAPKHLHPRSINISFTYLIESMRWFANDDILNDLVICKQVMLEENRPPQEITNE